jgi:hypothetical protein
VHKREKPAGKSVWRAVLAAVTIVFASGCAVHYFDEKTGTDHIWGFGHMKMKATVPDEDRMAVVKGHSGLGVHVGAGADEHSLAAGWMSRRNLTITDQDAAFRLEWPSSDFFNVRVGSKFPIDESDATTNEVNQADTALPNLKWSLPAAQVKDLATYKQEELKPKGN